MKSQINQFGCALLLFCGGTGLKGARRVAKLQAATGLDPKGPVRVVVFDVPKPQDIWFPHVAFYGSPYGDAVDGLQNGKAQDWANFPWLTGQRSPTGPARKMTQGAGMHQPMGRFGLTYNIAEVIDLINAQLFDLLQMPGVKDGLSVVVGSSWAGGAGGSMVFDLGLLVQELLSRQNDSIVKDTDFYGVMLGPQSFLPVTPLRDEMLQNVGAAAKAYAALTAGDYKGRVMGYKQGPRVVAEVNLGQAPFTTLFYVDVTRNGASTLGGPAEAGALLGDTAFLLANRAIRKELAEAQYNVTTKRGDAGIFQIGYELRLSPSAWMMEWFTNRLAGHLTEQRTAPAEAGRQWIQRELGRQLTTLQEDPYAQTRFRDHVTVLRVFGEDGSWDAGRVARLTTATFGKGDITGIVEPALAHAAKCITQGTDDIRRLSRKLQQQIQSSKSPAELRGWLVVLAQIQEVVAAAMKRHDDDRRSQLLQRASADKKLPKDANPNDEYRWTKWSEGRLRKAAEGGFFSKPEAAAEEYLHAIVLDVTRIIQDRVYEAINRALAGLNVSANNLTAWSNRELAALKAYAATTTARCAELRTMMEDFGNMVPTTQIVGLDSLEDVFESCRTAWTSHAMSIMLSYTAEQVGACAAATVAELPPQLQQPTMNGRLPLLMGATLPNQNPVYPKAVRLNPPGVSAPNDSDGFKIIDIAAESGVAAMVFVEGGHTLNDFVGMEHAMSIVEQDHPFIMHAKLIRPKVTRVKKPRKEAVLASAS